MIYIAHQNSGHNIMPCDSLDAAVKWIGTQLSGGEQLDDPEDLGDIYALEVQDLDGRMLDMWYITPKELYKG